MEYRRLGRSGLQLSGLSFGSWVSFSEQISDKAADELMGVAYGKGLLIPFLQKPFGDGGVQPINPTRPAAAENIYWKPVMRPCSVCRLITLICFFATDLIKIYRQIPTHLINVIEYNPIDNASFTKPDDDTTQQFTDYLAKHRVNVRLRRSRGKDIDAACGQLANKK